MGNIYQIKIQLRPLGYPPKRILIYCLYTLLCLSAAACRFLTPYTLHLLPNPLNPIPYTLYLTPYTLHRIPYTYVT